MRKDKFNLIADKTVVWLENSRGKVLTVWAKAYIVRTLVECGELNEYEKELLRPLL